LLASGKVLIAGGLDGWGLASAELYDPATGSFSPTGSMSTARVGQTATLLASGKVLITGGSDGTVNSNLRASAELYDPSSGSFSPTGSMSSARVGQTATLLASGKVLIAGGDGFVAGSFTLLASAELYDPATGTFSPTGSMSSTRDGHTATLLASGKVLIAGGTCGADATLASAELYDPVTGSFSSIGSMATARAGHTATLLGSGTVLITGGYRAGNETYASAELYNP
jgi:hypothetical protein